jgi:zinc transport system substrate-binding protein
VILLSACGNNTSSEEAYADGNSDRLTIAVSILPQAYFVERVGGDHVAVQVMVPPGSNPATYEPKPEQLEALSQARAYASVGVPFEMTWLDKFQSANPDMSMIDTRTGITLRKNGGRPDPHIWLSPRLVRTQATTIHDALVELDPAHKDDYDTGLASFLTDIDGLDSKITSTLSKQDGTAFLVFHPSWSYFADDYGLEMIPIEVDGTEPSPAELAKVIDTAKERDIHVVFAQPEFSTTEAETIATSIGGEVLLISPLSRDWLTNLEKVADVFSRNLAS